jgi:hypothetical protein
MHSPDGFGSGNFLPGRFGVASQSIIGTEVDTSKRLYMLAVAEIPFDVKQNICTKELRIIPYPGRESKKIADAICRPNNGNKAFLG